MLKTLVRKFSQDAKDQAKKVLETYSKSIFSVDSVADWYSKVMQSEVPVLLHCYTDWSVHCAKLQQVLQKHAAQAQGQWALGGLNIEEQTELSSALQVLKVPTLYLINKGHAIHRQEGMPDEKQLNQMLTDIKILSGLSTEEDVLKQLLNAAYDFLKESDYKNAAEAYREALSQQKFRDKYELTCLLGLLKSYMGMEEHATADEYMKQILSRFKMTIDQNEELKNELLEIQKEIEEVYSGVNLSEYRSVVEMAEKHISEDPFDIPRHIELANVKFEYGFHEEALSKALEIIELEGTFKGKGHSVLVKMFQTLGNQNQLVMDARKKLQRLHTRLNV